MKVPNIFQFLIICSLLNPSCTHASTGTQSTQSQELRANQILPGAAQWEAYGALLEGKNVGCVVNHSSIVDSTHLVDLLLQRGIAVKKIFAPEHGFRGTADAGEHVGDGIDQETGVPVISLYGDHRKPTSSDLSGIDALVFDIQDVGVRFYTYISTLHLVMEACAENDVELLVLDRPNPNGYYVDGPVLKPAYKSFIGMHEIPVVYGMTIGELAFMINSEGWLADARKCLLTVVPCTGYDHSMTYDLPVAPSPNLPNLRSVLLYPSLCFFEGTTVSVGRGTTHQFQVIGNPDLRTKSYTFTPLPQPGAMHPKYEGVQLYGDNLSDLAVDEILEWRGLNLHWLLSYAEILQHGDHFFEKDGAFFDKLAGSDILRKQIIAGATEDVIRQSWQEDLQAFKVLRMKYLLYPDFE